MKLRSAVNLSLAIILSSLLFACHPFYTGGPTPPVTNVGVVEDYSATDYVFFRTNQESFNSKYYARITEDGGIEVKPNFERTGVSGDWVKLELPEGLDGEVTEFSMDDDKIIALNAVRQIYTMYCANEEISRFRWTSEWGFPFWFGPGMQLREDILKWDFEVVSIEEDGNWIDPAGNKIAIGAGKCSHIIMLNDPGNTITFNDPWLPLDYSYEIGTPERGTFTSVNLSSSGSYHFIINEYGDMYTRFFDFDISGIDSLFFPASYEDQRGKKNPKMQLPAFDWVQQPKIDTGDNGSITDRISIHKIGRDCINRTMRVEGTFDGRSGFYEKDVTELESSAWVFYPTDRPLQGNLLEGNSLEDTTALTCTGKLEDRYYDRNLDKELPGLDEFRNGLWVFNWEWAGVIEDFNCYHSPAIMNINVGGVEFGLKLHYRGTIRLQERERGLDDNPREFDGAIEIPAELRERIAADPESRESWIIQKFLKDYLKGSQWNDMKIYATADEVTISGVAKNGRSILWKFGNGEWASSAE